MTCPWASTAGGTTAQYSQRNDGVTAPKTKRLHQRLGHINWTLHVDSEKPTSIETNINNLHKLNFFVVMKKISILLKKCAFDCWLNTVL